MSNILEYPLTKFHFLVDWNNGSGNMSFQQVTGLEMTREKAEYRGGLDAGFIKQVIPAMKTAGTITLKRGTFIGQNDFFEWWKGNPMPDRRNLTIILMTPASTPAVIWKVTRAFPTKFTATDLDASNNEVAVETLELVHEGIEVEFSA